MEKCNTLPKKLFLPQDATVSRNISKMLFSQCRSLASLQLVYESVIWQEGVHVANLKKCIQVEEKLLLFWNTIKRWDILNLWNVGDHGGRKKARQRCNQTFSHFDLNHKS